MLDVVAQRVYPVFEPEALMVKLKKKALAWGYAGAKVRIQHIRGPYRLYARCFFLR